RHGEVGVLLAARRQRRIGGRTWKTVDPPLPPGGQEITNLSVPVFSKTSPKEGILTESTFGDSSPTQSQTMFHLTSDGGATWKATKGAAQGGYPANLFDARTVIFVTIDESTSKATGLLKSRDGGETWTKVPPDKTFPV